MVTCSIGSRAACLGPAAMRTRPRLCRHTCNLIRSSLAFSQLALRGGPPRRSRRARRAHVGHLPSLSRAYFARPPPDVNVRDRTTWPSGRRPATGLGFCPQGVRERPRPTPPPGRGRHLPFGRPQLLLHLRVVVTYPRQRDSKPI